MSVVMQMLFKPKNGRKSTQLLLIFSVLLYCIVYVSGKCDENQQCGYGVCKNGTCQCFYDWEGSSCEICAWKVRSGLSDSRRHFQDTTNTKCSYILYAPNTSIHIRLEEFTTECGWDRLYVYDGDSFSSPMLAAFSGFIEENGYRERRVSEVVARSGSARIYFHPNVASTMSNYQISYRALSCSSKCSGHGMCIDGVCTCDSMYTGDACDTPICPRNCNGPEQGTCNGEKCVCKGNYRGEDCSQRAELGYWDVLQTEYVPEGSASHGAVVWGDSMYIVGGESYKRENPMYIYSFTENVWHTKNMQPESRYGHSAVLFKDKMYMYGGVDERGTITSELWTYDFTTNAWEYLTVFVAESCTSSLSNIMCDPLRSTGHTATIVSSTLKNSERMIVIFGHSPTYGYLNTVQEYEFDINEWSVVTTRGFLVKGGYGHSSVWDAETQKIFVYGGYVSKSNLRAELSNNLYSYDPNSRTWSLLMNSPSFRFLHSAVVTRGLMLIFGGNTNNYLFCNGAKCYSSDFLAYDIACDSWSSMATPVLTRADLSRFGHSAVMFNDSVYIYGGFDGQLLSDLLRYTPGRCNPFDEFRCKTLKPGIKCVWHEAKDRCEVAHQGVSLGAEQCHDVNIQERAQLRAMQDNCRACVHTSHGCVWCGGENGTSSSCTYAQCKVPTLKSVSESEQCEASDAAECSNKHNCQVCHTNPNCYWGYAQRCVRIDDPSFEYPGERIDCEANCAQNSSYRNCTLDSCIWCYNEKRCVDINAYLVSFPYGQCRDSTTTNTECRFSIPGQSKCEIYTSCAECRENPACGWCDNGFGTGMGRCLKGGNKNPENPEFCSANSWFFTSCPSCQCNGHSFCVDRANQCSQPCEHFTQGTHCDECIPGFYGNPVNGGYCEHDLTIDYQFTFNLARKEDRRYSQINFKIVPPKVDIDTHFTINCTTPSSKFNVTVRTSANSPEKLILVAENCTKSFKHKFSKSMYQFGSKEAQTTFYVYLYDFHTPLAISTISFSQYRPSVIASVIHSLYKLWTCR